MPDWSIMIIATAGGVKLKPDIDDAEPGDPLEVEQGDLVSWNNTTDQEYWPIPISIDGPVTSPPQQTPGQLTQNAIPPNSSSPYFNVTFVPGTTINYRLKSLPQVQGQLVVVPFGHIDKG